MKTILTLTAALMVASAASHARMVTIVATNDGGHYSVTNEIQVSANEIAELVSFPNYPGFNQDAYGRYTTLEIAKGSAAYEVRATEASVTANPVIITGPASIRLIVAGEPLTKGICTWRIEPESFPPDKTIIIPEGSGARMVLECSTNLTQWSEIYSATYTNSPSNKFFRIKAERLP